MNPNAATFDADISRYTTLVNEISSLDSVTPVHFFNVMAIDLKAVVTDHCGQWQFQLCRLLYNITSSMIDDVYAYIQNNSEL